MRTDERAQRTALGVLACALTALVYQRAFDLPLVFDDRTTVLLNPSLVVPWDFRAALFHDPARAVVNLSFAVDRGFWGFSAFGYRLSNIVLHIVVVALFYGTCTRALADGRAHQAPGLEWPAFFAAAAFGLHPLMSATALYVSARSEIVGAAAFMIALMFARRALLASRTRDGLLAAGFGVVAFASSPSGAGLPIVLLAYDVWLLRADGWRRRLWTVYAPAMAAVALTLGWRLAVDLPAAGSVARNMLTEGIVVWRYVAMTLVPAGQAVVHDARSVGSLSDPVALLSIAGIGTAIAVAIWMRRTVPLVSVGVIWFFAGLAATATIVPQRDVMAEPRVYLSAAGLILALFAAAAPHLAARRAPRIAATVVLGVFVVLTAMRVRVWSDPLRLWTEAAGRSPGSWVAHLEFSEALKEAGQCDRAVREFSVARDLNPQLSLEPVGGWAPCPRASR